MQLKKVRSSVGRVLILGVCVILGGQLVAKPVEACGFIGCVTKQYCGTVTARYDGCIIRGSPATCLNITC